MIKTFCDRCGAEIKECTCAWLSRKVVYVKAKMLPRASREDWDSDDKYICPECEDSYINWFMNPKGVNGDEAD